MSERGESKKKNKYCDNKKQPPNCAVIAMHFYLSQIVYSMSSSGSDQDTDCQPAASSSLREIPVKKVYDAEFSDIVDSHTRKNIFTSRDGIDVLGLEFLASTVIEMRWKKAYSAESRIYHYIVDLTRSSPPEASQTDIINVQKIKLDLQREERPIFKQENFLFKVEGGKAPSQREWKEGRHLLQPSWADEESRFHSRLRFQWQEGSSTVVATHKFGGREYVERIGGLNTWFALSADLSLLACILTWEDGDMREYPSLTVFDLKSMLHGYRSRKEALVLALAGLHRTPIDNLSSYHRKLKFFS